MDGEKLSKSLNRLSAILERRSKAWNSFLTGLVTGIGTAIGATLIGAAVVGLVASNINRIPILKDILPGSVKEYVGNTN